MKVKYISLVNLIADREIVTELLADTFTIDHIRHELDLILEGEAREVMLQGYADVWRLLGEKKAPDHTARMIYTLLNNQIK